MTIITFILFHLLTLVQKRCQYSANCDPNVTKLPDRELHYGCNHVHGLALGLLETEISALEVTKIGSFGRSLLIYNMFCIAMVARRIVHVTEKHRSHDLAIVCSVMNTIGLTALAMLATK